MDTNNVLQLVHEDDFIEYFLYPKNLTLEINNEIDILESYLKRANAIIEKYTQTYLWHRDSFKLVPKTHQDSILNENAPKNEDALPHLYGISHFGDNIDDEWFIVFLLFKISTEIQDLIIRVIDADGEFLLIEAANYLPKWANPDICENRVYIYNGKLHLVPVDAEDENEDPSITLFDAINTVMSTPNITECSTDIQLSIKQRIGEYPDRISKKLHRATLYLPVGVAAILNAKPSLVAPAVLAFCNRDPIDLKVCRAMRYFPPENRVLTSVVFTQHLYAMLTHSKYVPDRRTGWNLPSLTSPEYRAQSLGVRLACGFEILLSQAKPPTDLEGDKGWIQYLASLKHRNYFRDLLENSKEYDSLMGRAKEYYSELKNSEHYSPSIGQTVLELSKNLDYNVEELKQAESNLPKDDDDSWLNISSKDLDKMLAEKYNFTDSCSTNGNSDGADISRKLTEFMDHVSGANGAEFPNESDGVKTPPQRPKRGVKSKPTDKSVQFTEKVDTKINFDPNGFSCAMQNILDLVIPDDSWESGSEMSDYDNESENMSLDDKMAIEGASLKRYMDAMDKELASTTIGKSFEKKANENDNFDDIESFQPIDIDRNALKNIMKSYESQFGGPGPAENLLGPMGVRLESNLDELNIDDD